MQPVHLFDLAARHAQWATVRQTVVTANIANANTPGFVARDVVPFEAVLDRTQLTLARTEPGHVDLSGTELGATKTRAADSWDITYSGNSVSLDQELVKADETSRAFSLDAAIVRSFHRMFLASVRTAG